MTERKLFQDLPANENPHFLEDGIEIYKQLAEKYGTNSIEGLDSISNILMCSLFVFAKQHIEKDNYKYFLQLMHQTFSKNLEK